MHGLEHIKCYILYFERVRVALAIRHAKVCTLLYGHLWRA
jgi:hypothetical protein